MKYLKSKWKIVILILLIIIAIILVNSKSATANSPEGTIARYFKYWNNKDVKGMNSLTIEARQGQNNNPDPLDGMLFVKLLDCTKRLDNGYWQEDWYPDPYEYVCLDVSFEKHYLDEEDNRQENWQYYLVKESADSDWKIAMYGVG